MNQRFNFHLLQYGWKPLFWTLVTLVGGLSLTAYSLHSTRQRLHTEAELQFGQRLDRLEASIRAQFNQPLSGIRGAIGAQASTGDMRRAKFSGLCGSARPRHRISRYTRFWLHRTRHAP